MTMLSPATTYHAELREQLESVGRALSFQRGLLWLSRGLAAGTVLVLGVVVWAWLRDGVRTLPIPMLVAAPIAIGLLTAVISLFFRQSTGELARRVDAAARLQERSTTALELGARGEEYPLAIAQMRDAVEHLKRIDMLEAFPLRAPRNELMTALFVVVVAAIVAISPNPWLLRARASNPAITIAREQAQRVQRLADSIQPNNSAEIDALRQLINKGAKTIDARSNEPDAALNALQDLEEQVQQMGAGDDQLAAALAAIASALAADPTTQSLANAINTGDMRQISQAAKDLAQATSQMSPGEKQRVAQVLRDASGRAGRISQGLSQNLSSAADGLQAAAAASAAANAADGGDPSQAGQGDGQQADAQSASDALNQLSNSAAAADARQRAASQLESSRNALERALGRTQSRSGSNSGSNGRSPSGNPGSNSSQGGQSPQGGGQGQPADQNGGGGADANGNGSQSSDASDGADSGQGGGYSTGGQGQGQNGGASSSLDAIFSPQQVPNSGGVAPNESSVNPYTSSAGNGSAQAAPESVQPNYSSKPTQGNDSGTIPIGLRDLVKDYFSSLDQK